MKLTTMRQAQHMRAKWPEFKVVHRDKELVCWEGSLRPFHKPYTVGIVLRLAAPSPGWPNPTVLALSPRLHGRRDAPAEAIPHVYPNPIDPLLPMLCLFHPPTNHFDPRRDRVADTIIPWMIDWLACYEGWLATGKWVGGGVSH